MKEQTTKPVQNEEGFVLVVSMMILVILTLIGLAATNTTMTELMISGNEYGAARGFYIADSGWKQAGPYLNSRSAPPDMVNISDIDNDDEPQWEEDYHRVVRNYGDGDDGFSNEDFPDGTEDGRILTIPYWYNAIYEKNTAAVTFGQDYRNFHYVVHSNANRSVEIGTRLTKIFRVGY